jgi:hypothetical protein
LSSFYRAKSLIFFVFNQPSLTLDQHIGWCASTGEWIRRTSSLAEFSG